MEGKREKSPINAEQQEENIDSVSSDGQGTCGQPSSSTSAVSSKPESPEKQMDGSERTLSDKKILQLCPQCNAEVDPNVHKFCRECGKNVQEFFSNVHEKQDKKRLQLCPECNAELDPNVHKFCHECGKNVQEFFSNVHKKQDTNLSHTSVSEADSSEQISNSGIDVASNIKKVKQQVVVGETGRAVETQGSQQLTVVAEQTPMNETKTVEEAKSQAGNGNGNELSVSDAGHSVSDTAEQTSSHVIVVANKIEEIKQVVVQETAVTETQTESMQTSPASPEKTTVRDQNSIGRGNEGGETGSMDVDSTVHVPNKGLIPSNPDFPRHDENVSGVSKSESSAQISNSGSDVASNIIEVKQQVVLGEIETAVAETVGQGYQQLTTVSEKTSVNENKTAEEATWQAGNGNEVIVSDAGHTISGSPEQISNHVIFVANEFGEIKQVVVQETATTEKLTESVQQSSTFVDNQNIEEGKKSPREIPTFQELNEVADKFDEFVEEFLTAGSTNNSDISDASGKRSEADKKVGDDLRAKTPENDGSSNNSDISDASGKRSEAGGKVGDDLRAKTPENEGSNNNSDISDASGKTNIKDHQSGHGRTTRSTAASKDKTSTPQESRSTQDEVSKKKKTILEKATTAPLSDATGKTDPADKKYYEYRKPELEKESGGKNKKKGKTKQDNTNSTKNGADKTLTVVFHAILSDKFQWDKDTQIVIRGEEPVFYGWSHGGVCVSTEKDIDKQLLLYAEIRVPLRHALSKFGYKYVLLHKKKKEATYEELVEYQSSWRDPVNRCLVIGGERGKENKILHKYDGFVYPKPGGISWDRFFPSGSAMNDRRAFFRKFFPKWSGFYVDSFDSKIQPVEALQSLEYLVEGIAAVWTSTSGYSYRNTVDSYNLKIWKVFEEILMPKLRENFQVLESETKDVKAKVHAVVSSLIIAYVFTKYNVDLKSEQYTILLKCLKLPPDKEVCSEFMKSINEFDNNILSSFNKIILKFYQQQSWKKSVVLNCLPALPLLHFLRGESKPFEDVICEKPVDVTNWKWWGMEELPYRDFRRHITASDVFTMLPVLKNIFHMDRLLTRTFLFLCPVEIYGDLLKNGCFSCLELCVTMRKLLPDTKTSSSYTQSFVKDLALFFKEINQTLSRMSPKQFPKERLPETLVLLNNLVYLVQNVKQHLKLSQVEVLCRLVECLITAIVVQKNGIDHQDESATEEPDKNLSTSFQLEDIPEKMLSLFKKQFQLVEEFINMKLAVSPVEYNNVTTWNQELHAWNALLSLSVPDIFYYPWRKKFIAKFQSRIHKASSFRQIELFCQSDEQECNPDIATCLSDAAFGAVEKVVTDGRGEQTAFNYLSQNRSSKLLSAMLHKAWPSELKEGSRSNDKEKDEILLNHLLTWSTWPGFLKFFGSSSSSKEELTKQGDCEIIMASAESCLDNLIKSVGNGEVTVGTLKVLEKHSSQFLKLGEIHQMNRKVSISIKNSFSQRLSELKAFFTLRDHLECFIHFSDKFTSVDEELLTLREKIVQDYNELSIRDLCTRRSGQYDMMFFKLDDKFYEMVSRITEIKRSQIFNKLWQKYGEKLKNEVVTMEVIFIKIWSIILDKLKLINQQFLGGKMQLKKADKYLDMCKTDYDALEEEFMLLSRYFNGTAHLGEVKKKLGVIIKKVENYKKLFDAQQAAQAILELQEAMGLTGDFAEVERIEEIIGGKFESKAINSVSDDLLRAGELLKDINPKRRSCLTTFTKCFDLVTWLKESIKDEQELKVFVDLAMISAGEDDMEIDRISCMHTSCLGFGSLIFGYRTVHGFNELMRLCQPVWQAVDANPSIEEKLMLTRRGLSWLKQIKESHGSVALTTMVQVEAINSSGIYYIADSEKTKESKHVDNGVKLCLENLVSLVVPKDEIKNREEKIYSLEEVKDVQSKLMLIAGKAESGKDEVDQFNQVFEGILRVSDLYLQLCEVGEINYLTWKTKFRCSKNEGCREELLKNIDETCETMENELKQWKETIDGKRHECYSLNHFTMKQILNLRKELAKACIGQVAIDELPLQTFMLLETVNKTIDPLLLANVLRTMIPENSIFLTEEGFKDEQKYFVSDTEGDKILKENVEEEMDVIQPIMRRRKNSLETFTSAKETLEGMSMNYTEEYLLAALQHCGRRATEDDLVAWVVSCEYDEEAVAMLCEEAKKNPRLSDLVKDVFGPEHEAVNDEETFLCNTTANERKIERPKIVPKSDKPYVNNKEDAYLTLEILAAILEKLSESESDFIRRTLPSVLKEGEPNLLLVPKGEVFGCVLSLFMDVTDQPLPTDEEVIVCDENTTAEEIELLWRRAVVDDSGLLFCLANGDLLDYDVSQQAVRSLELLTQGHAKYHLVVICSIENEDKSNMVASFDQFRRQFPPLASMRGIQHYLKDQLTVSDAKMVGDVQWAPAATVDMEKLSVRAVQSSRAGMGKSLIVKHLAEQLNNLPNNKKLRKGLVSSLCPTIPVHGISVDSDRVTRTLLSHAVKRDIPVSRIFHLDMSQSVRSALCVIKSISVSHISIEKCHIYGNTKVAMSR